MRGKTAAAPNPATEDMQAFIDGSMPADPLIQPAWIGCLYWAVGDENILAAFREDTGNRWKPAQSGIEKMVDEACGMTEAWFRQFIPWFNKNVWGEESL